LVFVARLGFLVFGCVDAAVSAIFAEEDEDMIVGLRVQKVLGREDVCC
jgi:hypothetical protein